MKTFSLNYIMLIAAMIIVAAVIFGLEQFVTPEQHGSLLLTLVFWVALVQGCIALVAAAELSNAKWILPLKKYLFSVYPLMLLITALFVIVGAQIDMYPWMNGHQDAWLNQPFFIIRSVVMLLLSFVFAHLFVRASLREQKNKNRFAALYVLMFVITQSLVAFDWVMSLEHPWISTLFGGYFFIEATYMAIGVSTFFCYFLLRSEGGKDNSAYQKTLRDTSTLLFGFSLFWAGMFFAQYLTIWYGNLPEEVIYIYERVSTQPFKSISAVVLLCLFFFPFTVLLSRKVKLIAPIMMFISLVIMAGVMLERYLFIAPVTSTVTIEFGMVGIEFALLLVMFVFAVMSRERTLKQPS
ncbi:hypothetical protein JW960_24480 [candidate division KSB1 bacterium]|nr:hypothetical protein [candidate division KSB1 bacterium]